MSDSATNVAPRAFSLSQGTDDPDPYLADPALRKLVEFFEAKGLAALKAEDRAGKWYGDWLVFQATHRLYAQLLTPRRYSSSGGQFDLPRLTRFLEAFGYFSPAHGYSLQVTFLGLFPILMGSNEALKRDAIALLESGGVFGSAVSEKEHGADLFGNQFTLTQTAPDRWVANGSKYFIGNANCAAMLTILARQFNPAAGRERRSPFVLFAMRPGQSPGFGNVRKIHTLGVRCAFVGAFDVRDHEVPERDIFAHGRNAWDALFGAITLGEFFLGFGAIGICEHAYCEAVNHLRNRQLYGKPALEMPHLRATISLAYARLYAMKLYAYRALDYVQAANAGDRRYLLFTAVQKAKVSTEGVKVMSLLSECVGARGFDSETYFEMALRDIALIPAVEGSTHINLGLVAQFLPRYFFEADRTLLAPECAALKQGAAEENAYLFEARTGAFNTIRFPPPLAAYRPLRHVPNVRIFARQAKRFGEFLALHREAESDTDQRLNLALGRCLATIAYGQLIAEHAALLDVDRRMMSLIFHSLVTDLSAAVFELLSLSLGHESGRTLVRRCIAVPKTDDADWAGTSTAIP